METPQPTASLDSSPIFRRYVRPCCAEIIGTFFLTFASCVSATASSEATRPFFVSLAQGAAILALYGTVAPISGGHYNPAVSFSVWIGGGISCVIMVFYVVCQILGAFVGALIFRTVLVRNIYLLNVAATLPGVNFSYTTIGQAILVELIGSCAWSLTVLMSVVDGNRPTQQAAAFVGSVLFAVSLLSYHLTTAGLNPARALGTTLAYTVFADGQWNEHYVFWVGPYLGALMASLLYRLIFASDERRILFKK